VADAVHTTEPEDQPDNPGTVPDDVDPRAAGARGKGTKKGSFWRELPVLIVTALVLTLLIQTFVARVFEIPSQSMETTLHGCEGCNNDKVIADRVTYRFTDPKPGDVVIFRGPDTWNHHESSGYESLSSFFRFLDGTTWFSAPDETDFVKRVIATGGQTVQCCDSENRVLVDGKPLNEPYVYWAPGHGNKQKSFAPVTVPPGRLWVMGDNRNESGDSRLQGGGGVNGTVPVANVIGKAQFVVLPPTRWRGVDNPNPQTSGAAG
jgi:signal peptidase I